MQKTIKKRDVKSRIVAAAWELFYEKGYNGTTVDDIIALSGTSKGSFYYYFSTKDELLNSLSVILDEHYEELEEHVKRYDASMTPWNKVLGYGVNNMSITELGTFNIFLAVLEPIQTILSAPTKWSKVL